MTTRASGLRAFFAPPIFDERQKTERARLLIAVAIWTAILVTAVDVVTAVLAPNLAVRLGLITVAYDLISLGLVFLVKRGWVEQAATAWLAAVWLVATGTAWTGGGLNAPAMSLQFIIIVLAAWLLGRRAGIWMAVMAAVVTVGLGWAQVAGVLPIAPERTVAYRTLTFVGYVAVLTVLTSIAARANERLYAALNQAVVTRHAELDSLLIEVDRTIHSSLDFEEVANRALESGAKILRADSAAIDIARADDMWEAVYEYGFEQSVKGTYFSDEQMPQGRLAVTLNETVAVSDATTDERVNRELLAAYGLTAVIVAPLTINPDMQGLLFYNFRSGPREFTDAEVAFVTKLAASLALAMQNARTTESLKLEQERLLQAIERSNELLEEVQQKDHAVRQAYSDVIGAVTNGRLTLLHREEMEALSGDFEGHWSDLTEPSLLSSARGEVRAVMGPCELTDDMVLAFAEGATNMLKHAGGGRYAAVRDGDRVRIALSDSGHGIDFSHLPKATLMAGFSTHQTLGVGFTLMMELADAVFICTDEDGTTVVLEKTCS